MTKKIIYNQVKFDNQNNPTCWLILSLIFLILVDPCRRTINDYYSLIWARNNISHCYLRLCLISKGSDYTSTFPNYTTNLFMLTRNPINGIQRTRIFKLVTTRIRPSSYPTATLSLKLRVRLFVKEGSPMHTSTGTVINSEGGERERE